METISEGSDTSASSDIVMTVNAVAASVEEFSSSLYDKFQVSVEFQKRKSPSPDLIPHLSL